MEFLKPSGYTGKDEFKGAEPGSNGLAFDKDGNLDPVPARRPPRRAARKDGKFETLADKYMGKRLNSPNDLVFAKNGDLYFTDPPYGLPGNVNDPKNPAKELDFQGVYRLTPKGELTLLTKEMTRPNGIGPVAGREDALRRQLRPGQGDLDGVPDQGRRHARRRAS